jgi:anaerobic magnesium-protoporphyrin IX monomethyl ester cyclase
MKKILFVIPNSKWFASARWELYPYNVCLLAAILEPEYHVDILDANAEDLSLDQSVDRIVDYKSDYIGITCLSVEYSRHAHALARAIKTALPVIPVIVGGVYCTLMPEHAMDNPSIDYCVLGEGEIVLKQLLQCIDQNRLPKTLDGIAYRQEEKLIIKLQKEFIQDLDALPLPALDKIDFNKYCFTNEKFSVTDTRDATPVAKMYTSRGCPAGCNFCAVQHITGSKFRMRSVDNIMNEIQYMIDTYGIKELVFYDDNLIFNKKRAKLLFQEIIKRKWNIKFKTANIAAYALDKELLDLMKEAGFTTLVFAVESASNRVLHEIIGKPLSIDGVSKKINYAKSLGFRCGALFVIGNPGETWDEIRHTMDFAETLGVYCNFSIATPLPQTRLYNTAKENNYLTKDFNFISGSGCSRGWLLTSEFSPFDLEILRCYEWDRINFSSRERRTRSAEFFKVTEAEIEEFARIARKSIQQRYVAEDYKRLGWTN